MPAKKFEISSNGALVFACIFESALLLIAFFAGWLSNLNPFASAAFSWSSTLAGLAALLPMLVLLFWGMKNRDGPVGQVTEQAADFVQQFLGGVGLPGFAVISLLAGICEEALFRGVLQVFVASHSSELIGLLIASIIFGLAHAVSVAYGVIATLIGIYLGGLFLLTENLMAPVICHAVYDFIALLWLSKSRANQK